MAEIPTTSPKTERVARAICREQHLDPDGEAFGEDVPVYRCDGACGNGGDPAMTLVDRCAVYLGIAGMLCIAISTPLSLTLDIRNAIGVPVGFLLMSISWGLRQ